MHGRSRLTIPVAAAAVAVGTVAAWTLSRPPVRHVVTAREQAESKLALTIARNNQAAHGYTGVVTGRVTTADGRPADGFRVGTRFVMHATGAPGEGRAFTGTDGRYRIEGLSPAEMLVGVTNMGEPWLAPPAVHVDLRREPGRVDFVLRPGPWVEVRVHEAETGRPVPGVEVSGWQMRADGLPRVVTDALGRARFQAGSRDIALRLVPPRSAAPPIGPAPGYRFEHSMRLDPARDNVWDVRVYRDPNTRTPLVLRGKVVGRGGASLPGASVKMLRWGETTRAVTDAAGRFEINTVRMGVAEGLDPIIVMRADRGDLSVTRVLHARDTWREVRLRAARGSTASIVGAAVDRRGRPLSGLPLVYWEHWPGTSWTVTPADAGVTDRSGRFAARGLSPGALYAVSIGGVPQFGHGRRDAPVVRVPPMRHAGDDFLLRPGETRDVGRVTVPR